VAASPYRGVAVPIGTAYDTAPTPALDDLARRFQATRAACGKDVWPWVFVNRMIGSRAGAQNSTGENAHHRVLPDFGPMDFDPGGRARNQFLADWTAALTVAQRIGAPGVVLDLEFYNDPYVAYAISRFAGQAGLAPRSAAVRLRALGRELAGIHERVYPAAKVWLLTSGITDSADQRIGGEWFYQPRGYIALGLLDGLAHSPGVVIDGGEDGLGYCHETLAALSTRIAKRAELLAPLLGRYAATLKVAGTITMWGDASTRHGWLSEGACGASTIRRAEDFLPYLQDLNRAYAYNWVYAAPIGGYRPFDRSIADRFHAILRQSLGNGKF